MTQLKLKTDQPCTICGSNRNLIRHHVINQSIFKDMRHLVEKRIIILCRNCHVAIHNLFHDHGNTPVIRVNHPHVWGVAKNYLVRKRRRMKNEWFGEYAFYWALWYYTSFEEYSWKD